jgi:hypothetical protein
MLRALCPLAFFNIGHHSKTAMVNDVKNDGVDELTRLRARIADLERTLAGVEAGESDHGRHFHDVLYEAMLYGLGRTLALYDPASVRVLVREMGRRIREYFEESGYHLAGGNTATEMIENIVGFFVSHGFVDIEPLGQEKNVVHAMWYGILGLPAYERLNAAGGATFISCPLNAVISDALATLGKELVLREKRFYPERRAIESWEEIVDDLVPEFSGALSLDPERVLVMEREQSRQLRVRD